MGKVMNIHGQLIDDESGFGKQVRTFRENKPVENWVRNLLKTYENKEDFFLYIHKTKEKNFKPIIDQGLKIYEKGGSLESTMSRCLDSKSSDIEGDINYFLNVIDNSNLYGSFSIVAILPQDYNKTYELITEGSIPMVPKETIAFRINGYGYVVEGQAYKLGKNDEYSMSNSVGVTKK